MTTVHEAQQETINFLVKVLNGSYAIHQKLNAAAILEGILWRK